MRSPSPPSSRQRNLSHEEPSWSTGGNSNSTTITKGKNTLRTSHPGSHHSSLHNQHRERSRMITDSDTDSVPDSDRSQQQQQLHRKASRESMSGRGSEPGSELDEEDSNRIKRHSYSNSSTPTTPVKRAKRNPSIKCPICHEYVTPGQYQQHYRMELAQLETGASNEVGRGKRGAAIAASKQFMKGKSRASTADQEKQNLLRDIQKRRGARQNNKDGNGAGSGRGGGGRDLDLGLASALGDALNDDSPATCFICNERLFGSLDDINAHIDACLTNPQPSRHDTQGGYSSSGANTPVSGGASGRSSSATTPNARMADSFEEYTWAGQTRIRATALFEGGMASLGSGSRAVQEDIDDDLNVEDDEDDEYGGAQFTERDVVLNIEDPDTDELREIVMESTAVVERAPPSPTLAAKEAQRRHRGVDRDVDIEDMGDDPGDVDDDPVDEDEEIDLEGDDDDDLDHARHRHQKAQVEDQRVDALMSSALTSGDTRLLIEALRSKVKHLESANKNVPTCLICLEAYTVPLTSIVCWHVHCEACWMQTLGSKKLCPQCQKITLPKDLRRIYL